MRDVDGATLYDRERDRSIADAERAAIDTPVETVDLVVGAPAQRPGREIEAEWRDWVDHAPGRVRRESSRRFTH